MLADIEAVVLAGGAGRRMGSDLPKPLTPVAGRPLIWHVVRMLGQAGITRCTLALGHAAAPIARQLGLPLDAPRRTPWPDTNSPAVRLVDTGEDCDTGGRLGRLRPLLERRFLLCWVDGLSDVDLSAMLAAHEANRAAVTLLAVQPEARFGELCLDGTRVDAFVEKPADPQRWIHGGISIVEPHVLDLVDDDACSWERDVLPALVPRGALSAFRHAGHWACVDLPEDVLRVERLAAAGAWPWLLRSP